MSTATLPAARQTGTAIAAPKFDSRIGGFGELLKSSNFQANLKSILPRAITPERMVRVVLSAMTQQPKLLDCTPESVMLAILRAAACGLEPDGGALGQGYLVPYGRECQFIPGYRGLVKLARNSGEVADVWAEVVYEADEFSYEKGLNPTLTHKPNDQASDRGALKYAYAVARFRDGERKFEVLNRAEVMKIRQSSKAGSSGPWSQHEPEMWKKTAVRRLCKLLPLSTDPSVAAVQQDAVLHDEATIDIPLSLPLQTAAAQLPQPEEPGADG